MERREFIKSSLCGGLLSASGILGCNKNSTKEKDYGLAYLKQALEILRGIEKYETPSLIQGAIRASEIYKSGGRLFSHIIWGHSPVYETRSDRPGNPNLLPQWGWEITDGSIEQLQKGDFYFTNEVTSLTKAAKKRGTYIVGVSVPYLPNKNIPGQKLVMNPDWRTVEETSNIVLYSHVPYQDGLVNFPEYPMVALCPGSAISQFCYYWMMTAEISYQIREKRKYPFVSKAREYLIHIIDLIHDLETQLPAIKRAASKMAENIAQNGKLYIYDNANTLTSEACGRASGLMLTKALDIEKLQKNDNVIFGAETSNAADDLKLIQTLKDKGCFIVTISPFDTDGDSTGERLHKYADVALNNLSGESDGVVNILKNEPEICPASGIINVILLWSLTAQFVAEMIRNDLVPYIYMGYHLKGGREYNNAMLPFYLERGF